jgi:phenylpyruvate tautomerase PptA (4-oxalocrotonate tautomerase family)
MPIIDAQIVLPAAAELPPGTAQALADAMAQVFGSPPGRVWVRLHALPTADYAENGSAPPPLPVFLRVLHADLPSADVLAAQARALAQSAAAVLGREQELVHVEYAPPGRGRVAFGGQLVR